MMVVMEHCPHPFLEWDLQVAKESCLSWVVRRVPARGMHAWGIKPIG